ncbi:T9SS type B sorting domain-containing protein [Moheibacter sediminis]|uniref:Gliding motility-associated C-terminal domain-containing protein n=1 Tax=Moheibacter sediminis TaxID=1434700 RepID=A0A1W2BDS2_9FLAO|nr:T9SS type B sorting domain-containing protein [Moheibacter sediminis]SMC71137.1 gliding motility-associated C-terminal domain-containing protein [Moheibacter sediminis]
MERTLRIIKFIPLLVFGTLLIINQASLSKNEKLNNNAGLGFNSTALDFKNTTDFKFPKELFKDSFDGFMKPSSVVNAPDQIPCDFTPVCSNETFSGDAPVGNPMGTIESSCQILESDDVTWYYVQIQSGTTFTFVISPEGDDDYDFAAWLNPADCNNLGIADRASYAAPGGDYDTGLALSASDTCETAFGDGFVSHFDVQPGDIIVIAVDKYSDNAPGFELSFGGDSVLDCSILGEAFYEECDNDNNGEVQFDLNSIAVDLAEGDATLQFKFYSTEEDATDDTANNLLSSPYTLAVSNSPTLIYAQVKNQGGVIVEIIAVSLTLNPGIQLENGPFVIQVEGSGTGTFDLTSIQSSLVADPTGLTFLYYEQESDANAGNNNFIASPTTYQAANGTTVYVRVISASGCSAVASVNLRLNQVNNPCNFIPICSNDDINEDVVPLPEAIQLNASCVSFTNTDIAFYYLRIEEGTTFTFTIAPDTNNDYDFMLWQNAPDCNDLTNTQATRASYDAPFGSYETGLMLDETDLCEGAAGGGLVEGFVRHLDVQPGDEIIIAIYKFNSGGGFNLSFGGDAILDCTILGELDYAQCDDDQDGEVIFDLNPIAEDIVNGDDFLNVTFYSTEADATNDTGNNIVNTPYTVTNTSSPDVIYAQVKDDLGEVVEIYTITLSISEGVTGAQSVSDSYCDAGLDGTETVNLTSYNLIPNQNTYTLTYYETEQDAIDGNASFIPTPANYVTGTTTVYVRIENAGGCFDVVEINIEVSGLEVDLGENFTMCEGEFTVTAAGDFSNFTGVTFTWQFNGDVIQGATTDTLTITQPGEYTVTVNTAEGCSGTDTINVLPGEAPVITAVNVGPDYVIVEATGGVQPYQYSITGVVWQNSNQFNYLQPGTHTVYVRTAEGCIVSQEFVIFQIPTMFTPNGDGINDTWNIPGFDIYPQSNIVIYDRQGRLVYQSEITSNQIWNGFFMNGQKAPTQDYWYIINVSDGRKFTGHVTVKSRGEKN